MFRLSLIFFFFLALQPLGARHRHHVNELEGNGLLDSFTSLSFKHESFNGTPTFYKSVYLKKKKHKGRGTKLRSLPMPVKPFSFPWFYGNTVYFFSPDLIFVSRSPTPPHRGPPTTI